MNCEQSTKNNKLRKINLFLQNKPNLQNAQMNVNKVSTKDYENETLDERPKTNPIQTQSNPKQTQFLPNQSQNKPKTNPISQELLENTQAL